MKTTLAKVETIADKKWHLIDASDQILGRLAVVIANILRGRNKPIYTPHLDAGDCVVVINADKIRVTGKKEEQKTYMSYSGWMGNEKYRKLSTLRASNPEFILFHAVKGMLPKNRLSAQLLKKLRVFKGPNHTHTAQNPIPFQL